MIRNTGFQYGYPEAILPLRQEGEESLMERIWNHTQRLVAALALLGLSPVFIFMWMLVKATSRGPFLFSQSRPGLNGAVFRIYKVRTMTVGSEKATAHGVTNNSPQVTTVGRILRALKLDELPQLWNVAAGEMALVGPRPIPEALDRELRGKIPGFASRYRVRPGLTSIGQICVKDNAIGDELVADWSLRFEGELHYLRNRSIAYDLLMLGMTILYVLRKLTNR